MAITGDLYAHTLAGMQRQATASLTQRLKALRAAAVESEPAKAPIVPNVGAKVDSESRLQEQIH